jgi:signal transduction histidine kinase
MEMQATLDSSDSNSPAPESKLKNAGLLSAGLLHDLNNLLTVMNGYNEMLLTSCELHEKARQCLTLVRGAGERASALARSMMDLSPHAARAPQQHSGGFLSVETAKGQDTTVRIYLPAAQGATLA